MRIADSIPAIDRTDLTLCALHHSDSLSFVETLKEYMSKSFSANVAQMEAQELRMKQNLERRACLRRKAGELRDELTRIKLEIKMNMLEGATIHNAGVAILQLPVELTVYIFEVARGQTRFDDSAQDGPWESIMERPEIVISHVCRSWRSISIGHSTLWSHFLHIHDEDSGIPVPINWLSAYLRRSKKTPLDIILDLTCIPEEYDDDQYADMIMDILIPHAVRWRRLSMYVSDEDWDPYTTSAWLRNLSTPILEVLEIAYMDHDSCYLEEDQPILRGGAPNLISVRIESVRCRTLIPSSTITSLHLYGSSDFARSDESWDTFLSVVAIPTLVNLTIEGTCFEVPQHIEGWPRVVAPSLRNLRLNGSDEVIYYIWNFVAAPQLALLAIFSTRHLSSLILMFLDRSPSSFASLKTLMLLNCRNVETGFLLALSRVTKDLNHLILDADSTMQTYIDCMDSLGPSSVLWPCLQSVTCVAENFRSGNLCLDLTDCAEVINCQSRISGTPCVLRVDAKIAKHWVRQSQSKELWEYLIETGVVEIAEEDGPYSSAIPWPHHASGHFRIARSAFEMDI